MANASKVDNIGARDRLVARKSPVPSRHSERALNGREARPRTASASSSAGWRAPLSRASGGQNAPRTRDWSAGNMCAVHNKASSVDGSHHVPLRSRWVIPWSAGDSSHARSVMLPPPSKAKPTMCSVSSGRGGDALLQHNTRVCFQSGADRGPSHRNLRACSDHRCATAVSMAQARSGLSGQVTKSS